MCKFIAGLLFNFTLMLSASANAEEVNVQLSGFATATVFSNSDWFDNTGSVAVNADAFYDSWAVHLQVAEPFKQPIRRAVVERSFWITKGHEVIVQAGRFPRLDSFYNNVTDAPGTSGMAMLPLGEYSHRFMENRTFTSLDGLQGIYTFKTDIGRFKVHADYGSMTVENQCETQMEATKIPCRPSYSVNGVLGNYDLGVTYSNGPWRAILYHNDIEAVTTLIDSKDRTAAVITAKANRVSYVTNKLGIRYDDQKYLLQTEIMQNNFKLAKKDTGLVSVQKASNYYLMAGVYWNDRVSSYTSFSRGKSTNVGSGAVDRVVGTTYVEGNTIMSLEYHKGNGKAWQKYFAPNEMWNSWVFSITQKF